MDKSIGLIGTITRDHITFATGTPLEGLGGVLYQAAVLCGLDVSTVLFSNLGQDLESEVKDLIKTWPALETHALQIMPGKGNRVGLHYPDQGERIEVLEAVVPPLDPKPVLANQSQIEFLIAVLNSGFDIHLDDWRLLVQSAKYPVWLDIHSLALSQNLRTPRTYRPIPEWKYWAAGITYLQANSIEIACMLGDPHKSCTEADQDLLGEAAFELGVKAVFVTSGQKGVRVLTPGNSWWVGTVNADKVEDTTGCGDVFCAGTVAKLVEGYGLKAAATYGVKLATAAVEIAGIASTYMLAGSLK